MTIRAQRLATVGAELGEGPTWHGEREEIIWVDIMRGEVHACTLDGTDRVEQRHDEPVGAVALTRAGDVLVSTPRGLCRADGSLVAAIAMEEPDLRMNDGKPDPAGRFVGGTMTLGEARSGAGALWSISGPEPARVLVGSATIPNGIAWSADRTRLFWIDTPTRRVDVFEYDVTTGSVADRRPYIEIDTTMGAPDGMCIDRDDGLWIALWGGGAVHHYVAGRCVEVIEIPTPYVTCPAFVGPMFDQLAIATASIEFDRRPVGAGDLYLADVGVVGCPPNRLGAWAG